MNKYGIVYYNLFIFNVFVGRKVSGIKKMDCKKCRNSPMIDNRKRTVETYKKLQLIGQCLPGWLEFAED